MNPFVPHSPNDAFEQFSQVLHTEGLRPALSYLLHLTDYRYIGIFKFRAGLATAAVHIDRENPAVLRSTEVPDTETYCCYVRDDGAPFDTVDARADSRLLGHAARTHVQAYTGVPVMDAEGLLLGVLCLYDVVPRVAGQIELPLLLEVSSALAYGGHVPPYPEPLAPA